MHLSVTPGALRPCVNAASQEEGTGTRQTWSAFFWLWAILGEGVLEMICMGSAEERHLCPCEGRGTMKEGRGQTRALWHEDWRGNPSLFLSPRMAQIQGIVTRFVVAVKIWEL
jgi:hypothetical protein